MVAACNKCLWREQCVSDEVCEYYTPFEDGEEELDELIERRRYEFHKEWNEYITKVYED